MPRQHTNKLLELVEDGYLNKDQVIFALTCWLEDREVLECMKANEFIIDLEELEE